PGLLYSIAPSGEQAANEQACHGEILGPEENPGEADEMEYHDRRDDLAGQGLRPRRDEHALDRHPAAMHRPPHHELPPGAVPDAAEQHRDQQVAVGVEPAVAVAAERLVEIVAQPGRQADMPALPELS